VFAVTDEVFDHDNLLRTRTSSLGLSAAREAVKQAWGEDIEVPPPRLGVCMGTTVGSTFNEEEFYRAYREDENPEPVAIRRYLANDLSRVIAGHFGAGGPVTTVANACASGADALGFAKSWIEAGLCDVVIAGGADELARFPFLGFFSLKNASRERCKPFDFNRLGLNLGEAGAVLVMEREDLARDRGARILASIAGYSSAADAYHMTAPHPDGRGLRKAIRDALKDAGVAPSEVGFVNAHGTGTKENDRIEGKVLTDLLGGEVAVFSTKGATGHTLGAAGALEAVLSIGSLIEGRIPASAGFSTPDPECCLVPTTEVQEVRRHTALSTSLAFGGTNSALVLKGGDS
jgi:3-oxoacyl-(acyl-carrier-protein) synthase